jgi:hypothetical protein
VAMPLASAGKVGRASAQPGESSRAFSRSCNAWASGLAAAHWS